MIRPGPTKYCANSSPASPSAGDGPVTATAIAPRTSPITPPTIPPRTKPRVVAPIPPDPVGSIRRRRPRHCAATSPAMLNTRMATRASPRSNIDPEFQCNRSDNGAVHAVDVARCIDHRAAFGLTRGDGQKPLAQALMECRIEPFKSVARSRPAHCPAQSLGTRQIQDEGQVGREVAERELMYRPEVIERQTTAVTLIRYRGISKSVAQNPGTTRQRRRNQALHMVAPRRV